MSRTRINQQGGAMIIVVIALAIAACIAVYVVKEIRSHQKGAAANESYMMATERCNTTVTLAERWIEAQQVPPELVYQEDPNREVTFEKLGSVEISKIFSSVGEKDLTNSDFTWFGESDTEETMAVHIIPLSSSMTENCIQGGYSPQCFYDHQYRIIARAKTKNGVIERTQEFTRAFFY